MNEPPPEASKFGCHSHQLRALTAARWLVLVNLGAPKCRISQILTRLSFPPVASCRPSDGLQVRPQTSTKMLFPNTQDTARNPLKRPGNIHTSSVRNQICHLMLCDSNIVVVDEATSCTLENFWVSVVERTCEDYGITHC